jgi:hypothetical protein
LIQVGLSKGLQEQMQVFSRFDVAEIEEEGFCEAMLLQYRLLLLRSADSGEGLSGAERYYAEPGGREVQPGTQVGAGCFGVAEDDARAENCGTN